MRVVTNANTGAPAMALFDTEGNRKYLNESERLAFMKAADKAQNEVRTFCHLLHYTGCRISEALELTYDRVDLSSGSSAPAPQSGNRWSSAMRTALTVLC